MKLKKSTGYTEILELTDENDKVIHTLKINLNLDAIVQKIGAVQKNFAEAEKQYNDNAEKIDGLYNAALDLFGLLLGEENTKIIAEWYGDEKLAMLNDVCPYVAKTIYPKITELAKTRAEQYKAMRKKIRR